MVPPLWVAGLVALPVVFLRRGGAAVAQDKDAYGDKEEKAVGGDPSFVCERVCTSERFLRRMGGLAKDVMPNSCVTVCGTSRLDSCTDACQRAVCTNVHQVPAWNDQCLKRCHAECAKGRTAQLS